MKVITTHVLDTTNGLPAVGLRVRLDIRISAGKWKTLVESCTNSDGRIPDLLSKDAVALGVYRLVFETGEYFQDRKIKSFYPFVEVVFEIRENRHFHIPLLLSPFGYTTYRGS